jgi:hypothetical protein
MNHFSKKITQGNKGILAEKADNMANIAQIEQETLISNLKRDFYSTKNAIDALTDLAPNSTTSLRPGSKEFDAQQWVKDLHNAKVKLLEIEVELEIAEKTMKEWFEDEVEVQEEKTV